MFNPAPSYSYDDLGLKPIYQSTINSRNDINTGTFFLGHELKLPIVSAPMIAVGGKLLAEKLHELGGLCYLPRTEDVGHDVALWVDCPFTIPAIPATKDFKCRADKLYRLGCRSVCIDVANGFHSLIAEAVKYIKDQLPGMLITTGNIASLQGYQFLANLKVDAVRVGISNGSVCSTALATKVGVGQASLIREIASHRFFCNGPAIIADGGIKNPGDVAMAIALGADVVMSGSIFAGTEESPGEVINHNGQLYKHYAGQASRHIKGNAKYVEGADLLVAYKGPLAKVWAAYENGLRSSMAYMNCHNISDLKNLEDEAFVYLMPAAKAERSVYAK